MEKMVLLKVVTFKKFVKKDDEIEKAYIIFTTDSIIGYTQQFKVCFNYCTKNNFLTMTEVYEANPYGKYTLKNYDTDLMEKIEKIVVFLIRNNSKEDYQNAIIITSSNETCPNCGTVNKIYGFTMHRCMKCQHEIFPCSLCSSFDSAENKCSWREHDKACDYFEHTLSLRVRVSITPKLDKSDYYKYVLGLNGKENILKTTQQYPLELKNVDTLKVVIGEMFLSKERKTESINDDSPILNSFSLQDLFLEYNARNLPFVYTGTEKDDQRIVDEIVHKLLNNRRFTIYHHTDNNEIIAIEFILVI